MTVESRGQSTLNPHPPRIAASTPVERGGSVQVAWSGIAIPTGTDWYGIYAVGAADSNYTVWDYTQGAASGSASLPLNHVMLVAGETYELRLFANDGYTRLATSGSFVLTAPPGPASSEVYFIHNDHLGTPKAVTDAAGNKVWSATHDPFGLATVDAGSTIEMHVRFPGQYFDQETGLHYNYFRTYDPGTGRYLTSDPIGLNGGLNTYAYVGGNPLKYFDLYGLAAQMCYRPFYPIPQPSMRHCFLKFSDGSSSSFDPEGTHEDPAPDWWPKSCQDTDGEDDDDCLKKAMKKCKADQYDFTGFNCCHCVEQALRECGLSVPRDSWPNWPVNPGPQPGESGYKPMPQYGAPKQ